MKNLSLSLVAFLVVIILGILFGLSMSGISEPFLKDLNVGDHIFQVEIADTLVKQGHGLAKRNSLEENHGMLFVFLDEQIRGFWMKGMKFPLDLIWIKDNKIIGFNENIQPVWIGDPSVYYSPSPVNLVLEVSAGTVQKLGLKTGDSVLLEN